METPPTPPALTAYLDLKTELRHIAGIIEQYPDQLKQRAFELLITAYLGKTQLKDGMVAEQVGEIPPADDLPPELVPDAGNTVETGSAEPNGEPGLSPAEETAEPPTSAEAENSMELLRRKIRLRTMTPVHWQTTA